MRLRFKDSEVLEGLMPADLLQSMPEGYLVNPPDQRSNTQRIFVPRTALESLTVLAVIGATRRQRRAAGSAPGADVRRVGLCRDGRLRPSRKRSERVQPTFFLPAWK